MSTICQNPKCQKQFIPMAGSHGKYCSLSCVTVHRNHKTREANMQKYLLDPNSCVQCNNPLPYLKRGNKFCNNSCAASYNNKDRVDNGWQHPALKPKPLKTIVNRKPRAPRIAGVPTLVSRICPECNNIFFVKPSKTKKYCSLICRKPHWGGYRSKSQITKKIHYYDGQKFDSGAEVYFVKRCNEDNIKWERNAGQYKFPYMAEDGKVRHYYPDFLLPEYNTFVEIKGKRFLNDSTYRKLRAVDRPIELVMNTDIDLFVSRVLATQVSIIEI